MQGKWSRFFWFFGVPRRSISLYSSFHRCSSCTELPPSHRAQIRDHHNQGRLRTVRPPHCSLSKNEEPIEVPICRCSPNQYPYMCARLHSRRRRTRSRFIDSTTLSIPCTTEVIFPVTNRIVLNWKLLAHQVPGLHRVSGMMLRDETLRDEMLRDEMLQDEAQQ